MAQISTISKLKMKLEELQSLKRVKSHLDSIQAQLVKKMQELHETANRLRAEEKDVKEIEGKGFKPLFYKILGDKEKQIEKERQEYLEVSLKYNALKEEIELLEFEKDLLNKKSMTYPDILNEVQVLKKERQEEIVFDKTHPLRNEFLANLELYDRQVILGKELDEAINAGKVALNNLRKLSNSLNQALDWGRWSGDRSRYEAMRKRNKIHQSNKLLAITQRSLDYFGKEMDDLGEDRMYFRISSDELSKFTQFFFDNLITDWIIQQKIRNTLSNINSVHDRIDRILQSLLVEFDSNSAKQLNTMKKKDELLMKE